MIRRLMAPFCMLFVVFALGACSDTWKGAKQDTGDNMESAGQTIEDAGDDINN
jgi:predicted small secreted protein